jgi:hypothetical protein
MAVVAKVQQLIQENPLIVFRYVIPSYFCWITGVFRDDLCPTIVHAIAIALKP